MAHDLAGGSRLANRVSECRVADARALPVDDESVDFVLTSPPYCTRIDYVVSSSFELAALGVDQNSPEYMTMRRSSMGTPLARPGLPRDPGDALPLPVRRLLDEIRKHASKASLVLLL